MKRWLLVVVLCAASTLSLPPLTDDVEALLPAPNSTFATFLVQLAKSDRVAVAQLDARVQDALLSFPKLEPVGPGCNARLHGYSALVAECLVCPTKLVVSHTPHTQTSCMAMGALIAQQSC